MGFSTDFQDMTHDFGFGDAFGGNASYGQRIRRRLSQYDKTFLTNPEKNARVTERLNYFAAKLERKIAKRTEKGKGDTKRTRNFKDLLDQIYDRLRPLGDTKNPAEGISQGAARDNPESRSATIYLGGYSAALGIPQSDISAPIPFEGGGQGPGRGVGRGGQKGPARHFLGQYYSGGVFTGNQRERGRIP